MSGSTEAATRLWSLSAERNVLGTLVIGGVSATELVRDYGSPLYVLDEADFRGRCQEWRAAFASPSGRVYYGGKAFLSRGVVAWLAEEGLGLDVCSGGELAVAASAGFPGHRIVFHGNNKSVAALTSAVALGVGRIVIDSADEIARLSRIANDLNKVQNVMLRATPGVSTQIHDSLSTGIEDQKFGFSITSGAALNAVHQVAAVSKLRIVGIHCHIGSQIFDLAAYATAADKVTSFVKSIAPLLDSNPLELNMGGGLGVRYVHSDPAPIKPMDLRSTLDAAIARNLGDASNITLSVEPGRSIVAPTMTMLYTVGTIKSDKHIRKYVSVDGGMTDNIRPGLYGAKYAVEVANRQSLQSSETVTIVGSACETGDILIRDTVLPRDAAPGDLLAIPVSGAYQRSMASNFNWTPRPPVVSVYEGSARLVIRRETIEDLLSLEAVPEAAADNISAVSPW